MIGKNKEDKKIFAAIKLLVLWKLHGIKSWEMPLCPGKNVNDNEAYNFNDINIYKKTK